MASHTPGGMMPEYGDIVVGNVPVRNRAHFPVTKVIAGQQIVVVEVVLRAVGRDRLAVAPVLWQIKSQIEFNQLALRCLKSYPGSYAGD
ncbi:hypothetical protein AWB67_05902 [Caballeronia terrestris]|uniref:Uncharacterized protein n=1 Tax=Caballeronia terrestris TaxID=1226301 RepID=A0A158KKQ8_9BURK|nr:hypothetical protein AWB67_05902 [Caballeronia terrestris]